MVIYQYIKIEVQQNFIIVLIKNPLFSFYVQLGLTYFSAYAKQLMQINTH